MDVREKLVELIRHEVVPYFAERIADHLIANGVTVKKHGRWISLTKCSNAGVYCSVCNKKVWKEDYALCNRKNKLRSNYCPNCGARMDLEEKNDSADI